MDRIRASPQDKPIITIKGLRKSYGSFEAVKGISFDIHDGEIFGLLGPNGAGKTTTISMIAGLMPPDAGTIEVGGRPANDTSTATRRLIGIVPQELAIYKKLTGRENLEFFGQLYGLTGAPLAERTAAMLDLVGLTERAASLADDYSGGMKRRLNLAAGLMHDPRVLLLDEPSVGVDPQSRNHIFEGVRELNRKGLTVLYTSHYMEEVEALCDRVGIMDAGSLVACDTVDNLVARMGGALIEIGLAPAAVAMPAMLEQLRQGAQVRDVELATTGEGDDAHSAIRIRADRPETAMPAVVQALTQNHIVFQRLDVKQPNLEDVFLSLTGKSLRD
ncbi:MAG TPA: ABC transporter ATP-binding protein [Chthonomonadaceae bacterium]|nr:ABC transporter ATP-binding protein [Chthonomonadaceae bacterium]